MFRFNPSGITLVGILFYMVLGKKTADFGFEKTKTASPAGSLAKREDGIYTVVFLCRFLLGLCFCGNRWQLL